MTSSVAFAQSVVLVRPPVGDKLLVEAFNRLRAELGLQAFEVLQVDPPAAAAFPEELDRLAQDKDAFAAIAFTRRDGARSADVWVADRATGKTTVRTLALDDVPDAPSVLAVRTVDLLRESLRERAQNRAPAPEIVGVDRRPLPEPVRAFVRPKPPPFRLRLAGTALVEFRDVGAGYGVALAFSRRLSGRFAVGLGLAGPLIGATYRASTGSASIRQELGWAELGVTALRAGIFALEGTAGIGVYHLEARSEVAPPLASRSDHVTSFAGSAGALFELDATENVAAVAGVSAVVFTPRPGVAIGPERTLFLQPLLRAELGMAVNF